MVKLVSSVATTVLTICIVSLGAYSTTYYVNPGESIQDAIDLATHADTIVVNPGLYYENINFSGKNIALISTKPDSTTVIQNTILDGSIPDDPDYGAVIMFDGSETTTASVTGFTIRNGTGVKLPSGFRYGGGVFGNNTLAAIKNNVIFHNSADYGGGAYRCNGIIGNNTVMYNSASYGAGLYGCDGTIEHNIIADNSTQEDGAGLYNCQAAVINNLIRNNSATGAASDGGGMAYCNGMIINNSIIYNSAAVNGGGLYSCSGVIVNCIIWGNDALSGPQIQVSSSPDYSCIEGWTAGGTSNINRDPLLRDDYYPQYTIKAEEIPYFDPLTFLRSPCIDSGDSAIVPGAFDLAGNERVQTGQVDMGCYETPADVDADGMPDSWEIENFGDTGAINNDDSDTDGLINIGEYALDLDPVNEANVISFIRKTETDTTTIFWNSAPTHQYRLLESTDLVIWSISEDWQTGTGDWVYEQKSTAADEKKFFLVEQEPIP